MSRFRCCLALCGLLLTQLAAADPNPGADRHGDTLPEGAVLRLGTIRFRHGDGILAVAVSPDGRRMASVSRDRTACLWDAATGRQLHVLGKGPCDFHGVAFSPDGNLVATGTGDPARPGQAPIRLWDAASGRERGQLVGLRQPAHTLVFSPDGQTLLALTCENVTRWN